MLTFGVELDVWSSTERSVERELHGGHVDVVLHWHQAVGLGVLPHTKHEVNKRVNSGNTGGVTLLKWRDKITILSGIS